MCEWLANLLACVEAVYVWYGLCINVWLIFCLIQFLNLPVPARTGEVWVSVGVRGPPWLPYNSPGWWPAPQVRLPNRGPRSYVWVVPPPSACTLLHFFSLLCVHVLYVHNWCIVCRHRVLVSSLQIKSKSLPRVWAFLILFDINWWYWKYEYPIRPWISILLNDYFLYFLSMAARLKAGPVTGCAFLCKTTICP